MMMDYYLLRVGLRDFRILSNGGKLAGLLLLLMVAGFLLILLVAGFLLLPTPPQKGQGSQDESGDGLR